MLAGVVGEGERLIGGLVAGVGLVELIGELQQDHPVVVMAVDDAHWADHGSLQALTFALRRLRADYTLRPQPPAPHPSRALRTAPSPTIGPRPGCTIPPSPA